MHKHLVRSRRAAEYEGYPALIKYSGYYNGKAVPSVETLQDRVAQLNRYLRVKHKELSDVTDLKRWQIGLDSSPTLRMIFRRAEIELMHDIKELQDEIDMVQNAATEQADRLQRY